MNLLLLSNVTVNIQELNKKTQTATEMIPPAGDTATCLKGK